jgi:hypothetical protein
MSLVIPHSPRPQGRAISLVCIDCATPLSADESRYVYCGSFTRHDGGVIVFNDVRAPFYPEDEEEEVKHSVLLADLMLSPAVKWAMSEIEVPAWWEPKP